MIGTPEEVPVPRKVTRPRVTLRLRSGRAPRLRSGSWDDDARRLRRVSLLADFDEAKAQLVDDLLEELTLFGRQVAARLLLQQRQDLDHLLRRGKIRLSRLPADRVGHVAEMHGGGVRERQHESNEGDGGGVMLRGVMVVRVLWHKELPTPNSQLPTKRVAWPMFDHPGAKFERLLDIMRALRAPGGCPWDREQT